jgi:transposase
MVDLVELYRHWDAGRTVTELSSSLGLDRKTVRKYLAPVARAGMSPGGEVGAGRWAELAAQWFPGLGDARIRQVTWGQFDEHEAWIGAQARAGVAASVIWQRLRDERGVTASVRSLNRWMAATLDLGAVRRGATGYMPPTPPGQVAQIDYGMMGTWTDPVTGRARRVWAWICVLRYSRMMFVYPTLTMDQASWSAAHAAAFEFFGGVPARLVPDNLKTGVVKADLYDPKLNRAYAELLDHYGALGDPARAAKPKDKPAVERYVQYVRGSWWKGREFSSLDEMRRAAVAWCLSVAGARRLRCEPGGTVAEMFARDEAPALGELPARPFEVSTWTIGRVAPDCHVSVKSCLYSVPYRLIGQRVEIRLTESRAEFYHGGELVKTHTRRHDRKRQTDIADYPPAHAAFSRKDSAWVRAKAASIGENCVKVVEQLMAVNALARFRSCAGIVSLSDKHGAATVESACRTALAAGDPSYATVKQLAAAGCPPTPPRPAGDNGAGALLRGPAAFGAPQPARGTDTAGPHPTTTTTNTEGNQPMTTATTTDTDRLEATR